MKPTHLLLAALGLAVTTAAPSTQAAPPIIDQDRAVSDHADELFRAGNTLAKKDRWVEAEPLFREAWGLKRSYDIAGNLGIAEASLGHFRESAEHLTFALRSFPANGKPEHKKLIETTLARALSEVAAVTIKVTAEGAEVFVDGHSVGMAPLAGAVFMGPGTRKLEARLSGYETAAATVEAAKGTTREVTLAMRKEATAPPPRPPQPVREGPSLPVVIAGGSTTLAALVAGAALAGVANGKASDAGTRLATLAPTGRAGACQALASTCSAINSDLHARDTLSDASVGTFIGAGVLGLATLGYALILRKPQAGTGVYLLPAIGSHQGVATVMGVW